MNYAMGEHNPPHIHGVCDEKRCCVDLQGNIIDNGRMNKKTISIVVQFVKDNKNLLEEMWKTQNIRKI